MHVAQRRIVERHAGEKLRVGHVLPCGKVATVTHGQTQVVADQRHGLQGAGVSDRVGGGRDVGFDRVSQRVHASGSGQAFRHRNHQRRVVDRQQRRDVTVDDGHFHVTRLVGDDAEPGHLAGGAGGGVDRDQRQLRLARLINAFVIANLPAIGRTQRDALGAVVRRPTAQRHHEITTTFLEQAQTALDIGDARVRFGAVENH